MTAPREYDQRYFDKWYRNARYRVKSPQELTRQVALVVSAAEYILGRTLRTVLDARAYMVSLLKRRELRGQWQRACELLLTEADVGELTKALELALFYDSKLDLTVMA